MTDLIDLRIELDKAGEESDPFLLRNLERDIERNIQNPIVQETKMSPEGTMSGAIVVAIELAGLAIPALSAIWAVIQIRYRGQISIEKELADGTKITITKNNLTDKQLKEEIAKHEKEAKERRLRKLIIKLGGK